MPYKSKKDRRQYDKKYHKFKRKQLRDLGKALNKGDIAGASRILKRKPNISIKPRNKSRRNKK